MPYPSSIQNLINQFAKLPSVGPKTAERLVFYLLKQPESELHQFGEAIENIKGKIKICSRCFNFSENDPCPICADPRRDQKMICLVAKPQDVIALEKTGIYQGVYHVLGGNINPLENIAPENIKINELVGRIKNNGVTEIILALNPDIEGETTALYLVKLLKQFPNLKITRLARGLPMGADLEYADEVTLENAINGRREV
ncbi:MAG: recombination mediator RecR [Patescibacteria group bacterium]